MKLQDKETLSVANAVKDVLEGKTPLKEMDPKDHVSEQGDKFIVKNIKGEIVKEFETREEADEYAAANHEDLMQESPEEPRAKGEKDFKAKHVVKKSGADASGTVVKEETDPDPDSDGVDPDSDGLDPLAEIIQEPGTGIETEKAEVLEATDEEIAASIAHFEKEYIEEKSEPKAEAEELSDKQKKYQAFFNKALKKFGVDSPADLDDKKKKEFFDYVDKNYEADNEEDEMEPVKETTITISATEINKLTSMSEKKVTVDIDWIGDTKFTKDTEKKFKLKFKVNARQGTADVTGDNKQILKMLTDPDAYGWDKSDVLDVWPELK